MSAADAGERRSQRTRAALRGAFNKLILERGYDAFTTAEVADEANVGRSTFYKHFSGKSALFRYSLRPRLGPLADLVFDETPASGASETLAHFWQNRQVARAVMSGEAGDVFISLLADMVNDRLADRMPADLRRDVWGYAGVQIAGGIVGALKHWLAGRRYCGVEQLALMLHAGSQATARAIVALIAQPAIFDGPAPLPDQVAGP
jgi:AcrR family transcriptional regulator